MSVLLTTPRNDILVGDAATELARLPESSIDMVLTSPPYFRLRDYGATGQLGLERHVGQWVEHVRGVTREIERVLVPTGSLWLNLGDTFSTHRSQGADHKSLLLGPERLAVALIADGWRLRNKIVWRKTNAMPTSSSDRLACTWEALYVFVRQDRYFFDLDAIRIPPTTKPTASKARRPVRHQRDTWRGPNSSKASGLAAIKALGRVGHPLGKNPGDVWQIASSNYRGSHHATFPVGLAELAIRAGCPEARCLACRSPWRRSVHRRLVDGLGERAVRGALAATCNCEAPSEPGLVCDPFFGAGTTALGAIENQRDWLGVELNRDFAQEAARRIAGYVPTKQRHRQSGSGP